MSKECRDWLDLQGIHHRRTVPGNSQSNGMAERLNRTLTDIALCLLSHSKLPQQCFAWAVQVAVHIYNRRPHSTLPDRVTPYEVLFKQVPNLNYLRTFGCVAYRLLQSNERKKIQPRAQKLIHIGYTQNQKAYLLYDPISQKEYSSRDVEFDEYSFDYGFQRESSDSRNTISPCFESSFRSEMEPHVQISNENNAADSIISKDVSNNDNELD
ncbi:hypothetical protein B5P42_31220, partial [Bacillus sp. SRB_331]